LNPDATAVLETKSHGTAAAAVPCQGAHPKPALANTPAACMHTPAPIRAGHAARDSEIDRSNDAGRRGEGIRIPRREGRSIEDSSACAACWLCSAVKSYGDGKFQGAFLLAAMDGRPRAGGDNERGTAKTTNKCSCENDGSGERRGRPPGKGSKQARSKMPRAHEQQLGVAGEGGPSSKGLARA